MKVEERKKFYEKLRKNFRNNEELEVLFERYSEKYHNLSNKHLKFLVEIINALVVMSFDPLLCETIKDRENAAKWLKQSCSEIPMEERRGIRSSIMQLFWLDKAGEEVQDFFKKRGQLMPVKNPEDYLPLVREVRQERVDLIANYVLNSISFADKYAGREAQYDSFAEKIKRQSQQQTRGVAFKDISNDSWVKPASNKEAEGREEIAKSAKLSQSSESVVARQ